MTKLAIIGASCFQNPLILKAKAMGIETHVFAWAAGDVGEKTADFFYPISITELDLILEKCREIGIDGICSIASDLGNITVAYVAEHLGLPGNDIACVARSTDKYVMRGAFQAAGDPSPRSVKVASASEGEELDLACPVIVKPVDRSGSRGVSEVDDIHDLGRAIDAALEESFAKVALVEEFVEGREFSVEYLSWQGKHRFLAVTEKFTSGGPRFIEKGHLVPARITLQEEARIRAVVEKALDTLGVTCGASHSEVKMDQDGVVRIIEIGSRMGGDHIGSDLVEVATGYDFVTAVILCALGVEPAIPEPHEARSCAIRFVFSQEDLDALDDLKATHPEYVLFESPMDSMDHEIVDSSTRFGYFIFSASDSRHLAPWLPAHEGK